MENTVQLMETSLEKYELDSIKQREEGSVSKEKRKKSPSNNFKKEEKTQSK